MRETVVDWMFEVCRFMGGGSETYQTGVAFLDRYLSRREVDRKEFQGIGLACLWAASKAEGVEGWGASELADLTGGAASPRDLIRFEKDLLEGLDWELCPPIAVAFLRWYSLVGGATPIVHNSARFLVDLFITKYSLAHVRPSLLSAAALYICLFLNGFSWPTSLHTCSGYGRPQFARLLPWMVAAVKEAHDSSFQAVRQSYRSTKRFSVSTLPEFNHDFTLLDSLIQ